MVSESKSSPSRSRRLVISLLLLIGTMQVLGYAREERFGADSSVYIQLAKNLSSTGRYEFNHRAQTLYPPGFPVTLAALSHAGVRAEYSSLVRLMPAFATLGMLAWLLALTPTVGTATAASAVILTAMSPAVFSLVTRSVVSDPLYFAFSGIVVLALTAMASVRRPAARTALGLTVLLMVPAAAVVRSAGLSLVAALLAWPCFDAARRGIRHLDAPRKVALAAGTLGLAAFLCWSAWSRTHHVSDYPGQHMASYFSQVAVKDPHRPELGSASTIDLLQRLPHNAVVHAAHLGTVSLGGTWVAPVWHSPIVIGVLVALAFGAVTGIIMWQQGFLGWYLLSYLGVYLLWPFDEGQRFMIPIAPLALAVAAQGVTALWTTRRRYPRRSLQFATMAAAAITLLAVIGGDLEGRQARVSVGSWSLAAIAGTVALGMRSGTLAGGTKVSQVARSWSPPSLHWGWLLLPSVLLGLPRTASIVHANLLADPSTFRQAPSVEAAKWLRDAPDGSAMAGQFAVIHRITGRPVTPFPVSSDADMIATTLLARGVRYLVVADPVTFEYFEPNEVTRLALLQRTHPTLLEEVHRGPGYRIFAVRR